MKKFLSLLMLLTVAIPSLLAAEKSYTIMLDKGTSNSSTAVTTETFIEKLVTSGSEYISSVTGTDKVYPWNGYAKLGTGSNSGYFTLAIASSAQVVPTKIVLNAQKYSSDTGKLKINLNGKDTTFGSETTPGSNFTDLEFSDASFKETVQSIQISTTTLRANVKSITIYYEAEDTELTAPVISGVENGGVYWNSATVNISKPDLAASISYEIKKGEETVASADASATPFSQELTEAGNYTVIASATDSNNNTKTADAVSFEIKSGSVASIAELLEKGPQSKTATFTFTCPLTVTYANGNNVYVRDSAGDALLIYNNTSVTLNNGDVLPTGVAGTYTLYRDNIPELVTASLPEASAGEAAEPNLITIGQAADNMSQYVKIKNVKFNSATEIACGDETLTVYDVNEAVPTDMTAQYTVTGVISYYKDVQINLIAVTEEEVLGTPSIEVTGETNATGFYLDKATLKFVYPANATSMKYVVKKGDTVLGQAENLTEDATLDITTCGEISIKVTAYMGEEDSKNASETIKIIPSAPTVSLAAGTYYEAQPLTITAPEGATLVGLLNETDIENKSVFTAKLAAVNDDITTYELYVCSMKDDVSSDAVSATFVINPNVIENATVTGNIVIADQDAEKFIASGSRMGKDKEYILTDDLGTEFTIKTVSLGSNGTLYPGRFSSNGSQLRMNNVGDVVSITSIYPINSVTLTADAAFKINDTEIEAVNGTYTWTKNQGAEDVYSFTITSTGAKTNISKIAINYTGRFDYYKVNDGAALIGMEKGKFYQVNVNLEGVEANGGVLYACTSGSSAAPSEPGKTYFDKSYEDYDLTKFDQRDWVAIEGLTSAEYAGKEIGPKFIAAYDGEKLTPVTEIEPQGDVASYTLNTFGVANVFYGNYENMGNDFMPGGYKPFFVKAKVNEVANFVGKVTKDTSAEGGSFRLEGSGKCGVFEGKGVLLEAADGVTLSVSGEEYKEFKGVLVAETNNTLAQSDVKIVALSAPTIPTGVAALKADGKATVYGTEGAVVVNGADGKVMIFDAMGRMVKSVNAEGAATVAMPAGYYIVRTAGTAAKVMVK